MDRGERAITTKTGLEITGTLTSCPPPAQAICPGAYRERTANNRQGSRFVGSSSGQSA